MLTGDLGEQQAGPSPFPNPGRNVVVSVRSLEEAAEWYATLQDEAVSQGDHAAWRAWLHACEENAQAWQHIESVSRRFDPLRGQPAGGAVAAVAGVDAARRGTHNRRRLLNGLASVLGLGAASLLGWRYTPAPQYVAALRSTHHTGIGERREVVLLDGSHIWLNTGTALQVDYQDTSRSLILLGGEILAETAQDSRSRPFYVQTAFGRMQALGTRFNVRLGEEQTRLDVFDGAVEVRTVAGQVIRVDAGQSATFDRETVTPLGPADRVREAWRNGRLPADDMALGDLLAELARYRRGYISVAPEVSNLKVMGVYPTDDIDRALAMLEQNLSIQVSRTLPWWTTVAAR
jgi:transmembrane sensor